MLAAREAVGHAQTGDRTAARTALIESRKQLELGPREDDPLWLQFWSPADFACHETRVALAFGDGKWRSDPRGRHWPLRMRFDFLEITRSTQLDSAQS